MDDWSDELAPPPAGPRFYYCPRCRSARGNEARLCPECGETTLPQAYCPVCEGFWPRPVGSACPKHDLALEEFDPRPAAVAGTDDFVTVASYPGPLDAEAPRLRLEAEGIPTVLQGERMGGASMYQVATGGVKLQVPRALLPEARVLLSQSWEVPHDDELDDAWDELGPEPWEWRRSVMKVLIVFVLLAPLAMTLLSHLFGMLGRP